MTVCIPTYNMEKLLGRCLDSFILDKETMDKLQILVVNDGSKDSSSKIGHEYEAKYPDTFKVIDKPNGNYGSCINAALQVATGKYFRICDSDDRYEKDNLQEYLTLLQSSSVDIVFSPYYILHFDSNLSRKMDAAPLENGKEMSISSIDWGNNTYMTYRAMHCIAVKTTNLTSHNYRQTEGISYTDAQFVFYSVLYSETCSFFDKPIYYYYMGRDGQTMSWPSKIKSNMHFYQNSIKMLQTYIEIPSGMSENKRVLLFECIISLMIVFVKIAIGRIRDSENHRKLINDMLEISETSILPCPLYDRLMDNILFKLWKKYHVSPHVLYFLVQLRLRVIRFAYSTTLIFNSSK